MSCFSRILIFSIGAVRFLLQQSTNLYAAASLGRILDTDGLSLAAFSDPSLVEHLAASLRFLPMVYEKEEGLSLTANGETSPRC